MYIIYYKTKPKLYFKRGCVGGWGGGGSLVLDPPLSIMSESFLKYLGLIERKYLFRATNLRKYLFRATKLIVSQYQSLLVSFLIFTDL